MAKHAPRSARAEIAKARIAGNPILGKCISEKLQVLSSLIAEQKTPASQSHFLRSTAKLYMENHGKEFGLKALASKPFFNIL